MKIREEYRLNFHFFEPVSLVAMALTSKRTRRRLYQTKLWSTTICAKSTTACSPYIAFTNGMPKISVLGKVDSESPVITKLRLPLELVLATNVSMKRARNFWQKSANTSLRDDLEGQKRNGKIRDEFVDARALIGREYFPSFYGYVGYDHGHIEGYDCNYNV
ncbi:B-box type zinc finger family protein, partial [Striga asiatica]